MMDPTGQLERGVPVKNIVLCLDGTGNQVQAKDSTSVVRLFTLLDLSQPVEQVAYYDPGVGTLGSSRSWSPWGQSLTKVLGLGFGLGLRENLGEAYSYLMSTYEDGDRIFIFGFSRGAYTARALCGMLLKLGLLRDGAQNLVPYAVSLYTGDDVDWKQLGRFGGAMSRRGADGRMGVRVHYLGLWDTVKAAGLLRGGLRWPDTRQLPNVDRIRHAVAIDEKRRPFAEYLVHPVKKPPKNAPPRVLDEVWFAGVHSDVGGTFPDHELSDIVLKWMVEDAVEHHLKATSTALAEATSVDAASALGEIHRMGRSWAVLGFRRRQVPEGASVHGSVRTRVEAQPDYARRLPADVTWVDDAWVEKKS
jgi:uncharacterized protein (DUF2235 family)